jgi:SAM-dependent methyltransferase
MKRPGIDNEREFDWGRTSGNYAKYRPGYPEAFYDALHALGIGTARQRILDLGTGTGVLARAFAKRGATVTGIDIAENQIEQARRIAEEEGLDVTFEVCPTESMSVEDGSLDIVSAGQSWLYFDKEIVIPRVSSALKEDGKLVMTTLAWLPHIDEVAKMSDDLVLKYNPDWKGANYPGARATTSRSLGGAFELITFHAMRVPMPFTRGSWQGRYLACRGVGASLTEEEIEAFDREHGSLLAEKVDESFSVLHDVVVQVYVKKGYRLAQE